LFSRFVSRKICFSEKTEKIRLASIKYARTVKQENNRKIDSNNAKRSQSTDKNNNLSGRTEFLEGYRSSKTRVCVTVGMMTTGYDCQDILNLCMMRPIFSPTDFVQIKGRGTRKYVFEHKSRGNPDDETMKAVKDKFKLFDFFANCEYFEEKFNYDEVIKLPAVNKQKAIIDYEPTSVVAEDYENYNPDPLKSLRETAIDVEGMKIDRKLFERFEETVKDNEFIKSNFEHGNIDAVEEYVRSELSEGKIKAKIAEVWGE
jgi:type I restriction enzyme R subunit